jgi:hypothetical protein
MVNSPRPTQSVGVHVALALLTGGIGNLIYFLVVRDKQAQWDRANGR